MKEIDFVPDWYRTSRRRKRKLMVRAACLGVFAIGMILASAGRHAQTATAAETLAELQNSVESQAEVLETINELEYRLGQLRERRNLLSDVAGGAPLHGVLAELSLLMPEAMVLAQFRVVRGPRIAEAGPPETDDPEADKPAEEDVRGKFELTGWAASDGSVGSLMTNMARSSLFDEVRLRYSKPVVVNGHEAREFQLISRLPQFE